MALKPIYIRYRDLVDMGACKERKQFKAHFGNKPVLVTVTTAVANAKWVNWAWLARYMLNEESREVMYGRLTGRFGEDEASFCTCYECDPDGSKRQFQARCFAEAFLAQGGRQ